jgi:acyl-CoA thioesterase-1
LSAGKIVACALSFGENPYDLAVRPPKGAASVARMQLACFVSLAFVVLAACPAFVEAAGPGRPRIVCLGDSLTEGYSLAPEQAWPELLERALRRDGFPGAEVVNAGVSGSTSASAVQRLQWQLRARPDVLVLALGANDGLRGIPPSETKKNLAAAIDLAKSNGVDVLLAGMKMPPNYGADFTRAYEAIFTELAAEKDVPLLPFLLEGVAARADLNLADGIHPNAAGYEIIAKTVEKHLRPLLARLALAVPAARAG